MYDTYKYRNIFFKTGVSIAEKEEETAFAHK